ncbi:2-oxoglutarate dehydrogenase, E2 component, dihydrolipoamide succinyltransferase [Corynebacterium glucuronolyticum]|uniref:Dihydrolipoamide acetyltransferase component of pyruvate dehydrogenase complex n=4 Tax=Corynebacterium TaxID=1716 RepID=A0A7T4BNA6_9CORY|nr:2-oxoglutarate dehydrogenase, E2 component, dihydrolipoamide succinyltransferase [Corynebacterium glucuronolyticum]QQB45390.1 2-oxoglutarate dehydrogenase, E2 component, dihydrolipoamide succinyltransferase [Corynebacterium glucuronolyticum]WKD63993.1 Dihydrolipoyllysine-residue acetyltransferase component of pyruvate dehydrogenase complex [Corynebacterium glucuronolyticum DSM 44120]
MATSVEMPELGESVTEGTITTWLKEVGDTVEVDEPLLEVSTDKVDTEIPSPVAGVLIKVLAEEDDTVEVGDIICEIGEEGEEPAEKDDAPTEEPEEEEEPAKEEKKEEPADKPAPKASGSASDVTMPELGESVTEGTITTWLKEVGDEVEVDEPLLEVSTDKVDTEIPSPVAGTLVEILANEDDTVEVGDVIARIGDADAAPAEKEEEPAQEEKKEEPAKEEKKEESADKPAPKASGSASDVTMPELGESVTEGTITTWLKEVGDEVEVDEPLLEVSTDKVDTEIPSPVAGTLVEILANEDDTVEVGDVIARIGDADAAPAEKEEEPAQEEKKEEPAESKPAEKKEESKPAAASSSEDDHVPYVTPLVRKLAKKHNIDLNTVEGTGVGGRVRKQDILAIVNGEGSTDSAAAPATAEQRTSTKSVDPDKAALRGTTKKVNRIRAITAAKTLEALQTAAQLTQLHEVDMTRIAELRSANKQAFQEKHGVKLTYLPFFAKAIVEALVAHPNVNASYNAETKEMTYHESVNLAIAVDTKQGLLTPVIHDAQDKSLPELAKEIVDIADRARSSKLKPNDLAGATFTITNIGSEGALSDTPIVVPPQAAMVGTGAITKRPVVVTENGVDAIAVRQMVYLPMTYDHQVVDGADAGRFMTTVRDRLENIDFEADLEL